MENLNGKRVAILATDGFEQSELLEPKKALEAAGAEVRIVSLKPGQIKGWKDGNWGESVAVDVLVTDVSAAEFDGLVLPGGVINPDKLRVDEDAVAFIRAFFEHGLPVGAICHGPWTLINAGVVDGRLLTSYNSIRLDLENAGARWVDEEVVCEQGLVTSRTPKDLPAFCAKLVEEIHEGVHAGQTA
ncbi:type 1 glutamine amidotransferase [bacterium]|nr:MAG: type 1 glutamine amidotransferase [bacterium]